MQFIYLCITSRHIRSPISNDIGHLTFNCGYDTVPNCSSHPPGSVLLVVVARRPGSAPGCLENFSALHLWCSQCLATGLLAQSHQFSTPRLLFPFHAPSPPLSMSNILKRKNEDVESSSGDQLNKRVALDSEQLELTEKKRDDAHTAPPIHVSESGVPEDTHGDSEKSQHDSEEESFVAPNPQDDGSGSPNTDSFGSSKPVSSHKKDDDSYSVSVRMYCPVKEAAAIVGKKGEMITHIREKANVRIYVSENLKNVPERVISVKGSSEDVARAFGLITRAILEEPEDEPASMMSKQYNLKLLVPHPMVGYIIGKSGSKFREIEENSAAKLKAAEQPLPYSTDRVLSVTGVGDAIHIAVYYICQVMQQHKDCLKKHKIIYYNPANFRPQLPTANPMMNMPMAPQQSPMPFMAGNTMQMQPMGPGPGLKDNHGSFQQVPKPYNFQMMFQPSIRPQFNGPLNMPTSQIPIGTQNLFTDEHGNTIVGDVITQMPVQISSSPDKFTEDVFVANNNIGSVIGKGGNNIKQIRENSGCTYVKIEPDQNQSILLGGGKGLTNIRKLTLTGSYTSIQTAIYLINQRISADKERNGLQ